MSAANIRVLVAEDSPTARALLVAMLSAASGIEVIGEAKDGLEAVEMTGRLKPDVVTMDVQMPGLDGFEATKRIMTQFPTPIVIVSSLDVDSVEISMEALRVGALSVMLKPVGPSSAGYDQAARYLAATVRSMSQVKLVRRWPDAPPYQAGSAGNATMPPPAFGVEPRVLAIAASTGGPNALHQIFSELPAAFPIPILIVQHMSVGFGDGFAMWLDEAAKLRVKTARAGEPLRAGAVYLAPDDQQMGVSERSTIVLARSAPVGGFRPSASFLFESVGRAYGPSALGLILTGMGSDGLEGLRVLKSCGGRIIAQDEESSDIFGMPGVVVAAGLADSVLPLSSIAEHLSGLVVGCR